MIDVLIADELPEEVLNKFDAKKYNVIKDFTISADQLRDSINKYEVLVVRSRTKVTKEILKDATSLKLVVRAGVGLDNVDLDAVKERGVEVRNTPQAASVSVAEHAFGLMLSLARNIPQANQSMHEGKWLKSKYSGTQLADKYLGIVGFGRIGEELALRATAFKMTVGVYDVVDAAKNRASELGLEVIDDLAELVKKADYISVHVPYLKSTHHLFDAGKFKLMKNTAYLVNTSRGRVIDEAALVAALKAGEIAGAGLDVFYDEPTKNQDLQGLENLIATPHIGSSTKETQELAAEMVIDQVEDFFSGSN